MWLSNLSARRPSPQHVDAFIATLGLRRLTYSSVGMTLESGATVGFRRTDDAVPVADRVKTVEAVRQWAMHDLSWAEIIPRNAAIEPGRDVAMLARAGGLWWLAPARVTAVIDEPHAWGFAYGTLEGHVIVGEELFIAEQTTAGSRFRITALSRPADRLASAGGPLIRRFQRKFVTDALRAVQRASR